MQLNSDSLEDTNLCTGLLAIFAKDVTHSFCNKKKSCANRARSCNKTSKNYLSMRAAAQGLVLAPIVEQLQI